MNGAFQEDEANGKASYPYNEEHMINELDDHDEKQQQHDEVTALRYAAALSVLNEDEEDTAAAVDPLQPLEQQTNGSMMVAEEPARGLRPRPGLTPQRVLLTPATRVTKGDAVLESVDTGRHNPGAYQIQGRAFGAIPMWARVRQASRAMRSSRFLTSEADRADSIVLGRRPAAPEERCDAEDNASSPQYVPNDDSADDEQEQRRKAKRFRWYCWGGIIGILVLGAIAAGVGVGVALKGAVSSSAPPPHANPQCDFNGQSQPDIFQQCQCFDTVNIISTNVANQYNDLKANATMLWNISIPDESMDSCAPQNQALLWIATGLAAGALDANHPQQLLNRYVLTVLFMELGGPTWTNHHGWVTPDPECTWYGISCQQQNITGISLSNNNVTSQGRIPPELYLLTGLNSLYLAGNSLTGNVSSAIAGLRNLETLCLGGNLLSGSFPYSDVTTLTKLRFLDISNNRLTGAIPTTIGRLAALEAFLAPNTLMTGTIPTEIAELTRLVLLDFTYNTFTGSVPTQIGKLTNLEFLQIGGHLAGTLPTELAKLTRLRYLGAIAASLSGTIPTQLGSLSHLVQLQLSSNTFKGTIPSSLALCTSLTILQLKDNSLTGTVPGYLGLIPTLNVLDLSQNQLQGTIPEELFQNRHLNSLILANNKLNGNLPTDVKNATTLACVDISSNSLTGSVPSSLCTLPSIEKVAVNCGIAQGCSCCDCQGSGVCSEGTFALNTNNVRPNVSIGLACG